MSFKLYEPGRRKNNRDWVARYNGTYNGTPHPEKVLTGCKTHREAYIRASQIELELMANETPDAADDISFREAAYLYAKWRKLDLDAPPRFYREHQRSDQKRIKKLIGSPLGLKSVRSIKVADLVATAETLYPHVQPQTQNREVMLPAAAILHYAAKNGYCAWLRVKHFDTPEPETRTVPLTTEKQLVNAPNTTQYQHLLLMWLFLQGTRITQTLSVGWEHIDLNARVPSYRFFNKKRKGGGKWETKPLDPEVFELLCAIPAEQRHGKLWPWSHRSGVNHWLVPLTRRLGVTFTAHMARHTLGKALSDAGRSQRQIMDTLGHLDPKSSLRYQSTDMEGISAALAAAKAVKAR